jgi:hypothetical protein
MPLSRARETLAAATTVTRDNLDAVWAAMVSLTDGTELLAAAGHLDWQHPPRGKYNIALVERYGAGALPWLGSRREHGILVNHPWCVVPSILALDAPAALALLLEVDGVATDGGHMTAWIFERDGAHPQAGSFAEDAARLVLEWTRLHPDAAYPVLARHAPTSPRAAAALRALAKAAPSAVHRRLAALGASALATALALPDRLDPDTILAGLDAASRQSWPIFVTGVDGRLEYFAQRLIAVRAREGDGWAIVFERLQGCNPDAFAIARYAYGPNTSNGYNFDTMQSLYEAFSLEVAEGVNAFHKGRVVGPAGPLELDESWFTRHDLRPGLDVEFGGWPAFTLAVRAYLAEHPGAFWPPATDALTAAGLPDGELLVVTTDYQHPSGGSFEPEDAPWILAPSQSPAIRTLVEALLARDASLFIPGPSNTDWRLHARVDNRAPHPASLHREDTARGFLPAAMREAGVDPDARGLMPLDRARAIVADLRCLVLGQGRHIGDRWVWDRDLAWAALLSLEDAAETARAFARCKLVDGPRDAAENLALHERFGDAALTVVGALADASGIIGAASPFVRATVLAVGSPAGFAFVWDVAGWREPGAEGTPDTQATALFTAWVTAYPATGYVELARRALAGDPAALHFLSTWAAPQPRRVFGMLRDGLGEADAQAAFGKAGLSWRLIPAHITACLDLWAAPGDPNAWPLLLTGQGPSAEYHALRLIAVRHPQGDDWAVVLERFQGYNQHLSVQRFVYGEGLPSGRREDLKVSLAHLNQRVAALAYRDEDTALREPPDYWTQIDKAPIAIARARALFAEAPEAIWPDVGDLLAKLGFPLESPRIVSTAFAHTEGPGREQPLPSASPYQSLAEALVSRDFSRFAGGVSNLGA